MDHRFLRCAMFAVAAVLACSGGHLQPAPDAGLPPAGGPPPADVAVTIDPPTVTLQPLSVSGQVGLNLAVGVASIHLGPPMARR